MTRLSNLLNDSTVTVINQLLLRQIINELLLSFDIILFIILVRYIIVESRKFGPGWWRQPNLQAAMAFTTVFFGHAMVRGWAFVTFVNIGRGGGLLDLENAYPIALAGTIVTVFGLCWLIRIFLPKTWGERGWFFCLMLALVFVGLMRIVL